MAIVPSPASALRRRLSLAERAFVVALAADPTLDAPRAAATAGFADPAKACRRLLARGRVRRALDRLLAKRIAGPREVLGEITDIALSPDTRFASEMYDAKTGALVGRSLHIAPKVEALKLLARHHGLTASPLDRAIAKLVTVEVQRMSAVDSHTARGPRLRHARRVRKLETTIEVQAERIEDGAPAAPAAPAEPSPTLPPPAPLPKP